MLRPLKQTSEENLENVLQNEKAKLLEGSQEESTADSSVDWKGQLRDAVSRIQAPMQCYFTFQLYRVPIAVR